MSLHEGNIIKNKELFTQMDNPFQLNWIKDWSFKIVIKGGIVLIEASGLGVSVSTCLLPGESPISAADRLVLNEDQRRRSLHKIWKRDLYLIKQTAAG